MAGDWNGDGTDTPGVVRGTTWFLRTTNDPAVTNRVMANLRALPGIIAELKRRGYGFVTIYDSI